jgi:hypothetical protein
MMKEQFDASVQKVNLLLSQNKLKQFTFCQEKIDSNFENFLFWNTPDLQSLDEIHSLAKYPIMPVYLDNLVRFPVLIKTESILEYFKSPYDTEAFNVLYTGYHGDLKMPSIANMQDNVWDKFPKEECCYHSRNLANYFNSVILTGKGFVTLPHSDEDTTPGTNLISCHSGRKLWIVLDQAFQEENMSLDRFFQGISFLYIVLYH